MKKKKKKREAKMKDKIIKKSYQFMKERIIEKEISFENLDIKFSKLMIQG